MRQWSLLFLMYCLVACSTETNYAPVTDIATIEHIPKNGMYRVAPGETLYSIAWRYGLDYRELVNLNHIAPPFHVVAGQRIYLNSRSAHLPFKKNRTPVLSRPVNTTENDSNKWIAAWHWPAKGPIVGMYSSLNKGINIGGHLGTPIYAAASGQVVYSGNGLRGYGNLIIIKHNSHYLSAYAHSKVVLVKEGQHVKAGQEIAEMGSTGTERVILHFEMRRNGQPVNPLNYLAPRI